MAITKITTPELFDFSATNTALQLPTGDTASRPSAPSTGEWRYNSELKYVEYYDGADWFQIDTEAIAISDTFPSENFNVNTYTGNGATQTIDAKFNEAANFNGTTSRITSAPISGLSNASVSLWLKSSNSSSSESRGIIELNGDTSSNGYAGTLSVLYTYSSGAILVRSGNSSSSETDLLTHTDTTLRDGNWNNLVVTRNESTGFTTLYINGSQVDQENVASTSSVGPGTFIGDRATGSGGNYNWDGAMDQVRIFNTALTADQAEDCYTDETTTTAATLNFPAGAGCIAAYQLDGDASDVGGTYGGVEKDIGYTGFKFQPDFVWIKKREGTGYYHQLYDSVRGAANVIFSNDALTDYSRPDGLTSFNNNGFTLGSNTNSNQNPGTFVAWCWKAGGAPDATNSNGAGSAPTLGSVIIDGVKSTAALVGSIAATKISANTEAGFSVIQWIGTEANATVDHGLTSAPRLIFFKAIGRANNWGVYNADIGPTNYMTLNRLDQSLPASTATNNLDPTTTVINLGSSLSFNANNSNSPGGMIAYAFHNVNGYQRISSYNGNGSASGPIIYTTNDGTATGTDGFEPAWIMIKRTDSTGAWNIFDNKRNPANPRNTILQANTDDPDITNTAYNLNFYTNGFQFLNTNGDWNASGGSYIFLAIAADKDTSVPTAANSFSPTTYTGTSAALNIATPFAPDWTWIKSTTIASSHGLYDTIRGGAKWITSNGTNSNQDTPTALQKFNPNGFTLGDDSGAWGVNASSATYISWNWKAGGLPTINNDGTIPSIVTANTAAGFSIARYTATSATSESIGHGLTSLTPSLIFYKKTSNTEGWIVWYPESSNNQNWLELNDQRQGNFDNAGWGGSPDSTVVHLQDNNSGRSSANGETYIAYIFADIAGYQRIGNYQGSGSAGKQVYVTDDGLSTGSGGFQPSYVLIKCSSDGGTDWLIFTSNVVDGSGNPTMIRANTAETQFTGDRLQFTSYGFTLSDNDGSRNGSGRTYYYLAIK